MSKMKYFAIYPMECKDRAIVFEDSKQLAQFIASVPDKSKYIFFQGDEVQVELNLEVVRVEEY